MDEKIKSYIQDQLQELARKNDVRILLAIESGSRAWGFPSQDSDYDVRFIYAHKEAHYLSIDRKRDVIETPIQFDPVLNTEFDMNGWDVKKAIYLAMRGNAVVNEWMTSPIQYIKDGTSYQDLQNFVAQTADLRAYFHFYRNYMREPWLNYLNNHPEQIKIKHYCYCLRCALALEWLLEQETIPPMDVPSLLKGIQLKNEVLLAIENLIALKKQSTEKDTMERIEELDQFIDAAINQERKRPSKDDLETQYLDTANALFRRIVKDAY